MSFDYLLRVPIIFFIDELFKSNFELADFANKMFPVNNTLDQMENGEPTQYYMVIIKIIVSFLMFCSSLCLLILPSKYLFPVYLRVMSVYVVLVSYWENIQTRGILYRDYKNIKIDMANELVTWDVDGYIIIFIQLYSRLYKLFHNLILQYCLSLVFGTLHVLTTNNSIHKVFRYSFIIPTLIVSIPNTSSIFNIITILSTFLQLFILLKTLFLNIFTITSLIRSGYNHTKAIINAYGICTMVELEWCRLKIPRVFRAFWMTRVLIQVLDLTANMETKKFTLFEAVKYLSINGCDTFTAVLGMTSFVSYFCDLIEKFFQRVLLINELEDITCGEISAMICIIRSIIYGLTGLNPENRWIEVKIIVRSIYNHLRNWIYMMVVKSLKHLSDSNNRSLIRHSRVLLVCGFLIAVPVTTLYNLFSFYHSVDYRLIVSLGCNIICIMKILVSLTVHSLLIIDSNSLKCWENIDDYVFYINSFRKILQFCFFNVLLLINIYEYVFVSGGGVIQAFMICVEVYFEVNTAREGWRIFIQRRRAVKKIEPLTDATIIQLSEFNDVCAICYQKMKSAKITKCNHYFHSRCLLKWTYLQDKCPLCRKVYNKAEM